MHSYKNIAMMLGLSALGVLYGADEELSPSSRRVKNYLGIIESVLGYKSSDLKKGIELFLQANFDQDNIKKAIGFFDQATASRDPGLRAKSHLYKSAVLFLGSSTENRDGIKAFAMAEQVIWAEHALPLDRFRAYLIIDEIMHTPGSMVQFDTKTLLRSINKIGEFALDNKELDVEITYRYVRLLLYTYPKKKRYLCYANQLLKTIAIMDFDGKESLENDIHSLLKDAENRPADHLNNSENGRNVFKLGQLRRSPPLKKFAKYPKGPLLNYEVNLKDSESELISVQPLWLSKKLSNDAWSDLRGCASRFSEAHAICKSPAQEDLPIAAASSSSRVMHNRADRSSGKYAIRRSPAQEDLAIAAASSSTSSRVMHNRADRSSGKYAIRRSPAKANLIE